MEAAARLVNRPSPPIPAAAVKVAEPVVVQATPTRVQCQSLRVSAPGDAAEVEARHVARSIVSMPATAAARPASVVSPPTLHRANPVRGPAVAAPTRPQQTAAKPTASGGEPLPEAVRQDMESRFGADFSAVRIHRDARAAQASSALNAAAFTVGQQIHFGAGQFNPASSEGRELIAHELTHTIQQGAAPQRPLQQMIQRSPAPQVVERSPPAVQRLGLGDALNYFAEHANFIPGFRMFTLVLGVNPINMRAVDRSPGNLLRALVELMPGGALITRALDGYGIIDRVAGWVQQQMNSLGLVASSIRQAVDRFLDSLSWTDIFDLGGVWERAKRIVTEPIARITSFVGNLVSGILQFIRDAVLRPLAALAQGTRGWDLLCAVLGRNPITGDAVPRTAETLIGGFMRLIGQEEVWHNLQESRAVPRAMAWFQGALAGLMGFVTALPGLFMDTLRSLGINDLLTPVQTFGRIVRVFGDFAGRFVGWAGAQVMSLLEIIFDVVAPAVMPYIRRAAGAFRTIVANPVNFVRNLVRAAVQGFRQFASNILTHLRAALIGWLTGAMGSANIYIPQALTLQEIIKFVLSVLGLTWQNIRSKLVRAVGETAVNAMETGFDIVVTLVRDGPAAAWERIRESLSNLREMVMEQIMAFVQNNIVMAAVTRLVSMLNPAGAFIQAIIAIYNTVMFFVERLRQIAQVAAAFIDSIAAIAGGVIAAAANRVEQTMAGLLTLVISFLARLVGLGRVSDAVTNIINRIRAPIDRALDRVVAWIVNLGRRFMTAARSAAGRVAEWWRQRKPFRTAGGESHEVYFVGDERNAIPLIGATRTAVRANADDPIVVTNLRTLFGIFDDPSTPRVTRYQPRTQSLGGDTVGVGMTIDWLNDAWRRSHPGSPPRSGAQSTLMSKLETDPGESSPDKFIRGHLLNEHIGGVGDATNLFPITGNANSRHLHSTESRVKRWVDVPGNWVFYEVTVDGISSRLNASDVTQNYVNATFNCRAVLKDDDGTEKESYMTAISSTYRVRNEARAFQVR
ncbi:MAG: hypothetical protein H6R16_1157 [Proteobacteria bacterium]|nr:hypothetical protein [Pseudomonadota bacterium]